MDCPKCKAPVSVRARFCDQCGAKLYETARHVPDYNEDPVSRVYEEFYGSVAHRTCDQCGWVAPIPPGASVQAGVGAGAP